MNKVLDNIITRMRSWPKDRQEDAARVLETMEQTGITVYRLTDEERILVQEGLDQAERGEFVSDNDMSSFWNRRNA